MDRALGLDIRNGKASVGGDGNTPISWTTSPDIARFVVYVLTSLPASKLEWQTFRIEGERAVSPVVLDYDSPSLSRDMAPDMIHALQFL